MKFICSNTIFITSIKELFQWNNINIYDKVLSLTHLGPMFLFYTLSKKDFLIISGDEKKDPLPKMGQQIIHSWNKQGYESHLQMITLVKQQMKQYLIILLINYITILGSTTWWS